MSGEEGEGRNEDGGPDSGCELEPCQYIWGFVGEVVANARSRCLLGRL